MSRNLGYAFPPGPVFIEFGGPSVMVFSFTRVGLRAKSPAAPTQETSRLMQDIADFWRNGLRPGWNGGRGVKSGPAWPACSFACCLISAGFL